MPSDEQLGFWKLIKELTVGVWGITKEVGKEAHEEIKSYSKNTKVEAQKHRLEHFEKLKTLHKRAKDAGISEESIARFMKEVGIEQKKPEDGPSGTGDSGGLLEITCNGIGMLNEKLIETRFEQYIRHFNDYKNMYKKAVASNLSLDQIKEILKDPRFTLSEIKAAAESEIEGSADEASCEEERERLKLLSKMNAKEQAYVTTSRRFRQGKL
tara:strand:+ start:500 stop:1135 length:636 start_codon:yes stop_codon:yes gene_type:complete